jgi:drug/metabolite transporter (DMT)-like permease
MKAQRLHLRALGSALVGFTLWVLADSLMKLAGESSLPPYEIVGFLGMFGCVFLVVKTAAQRKLSNLRPKSLRTQMMRAPLAVGCNFCNVIALKHLPLTDFYITVFTAPIIIAVFAAFFLDERLSGPTTLAILVGFCGVILAISPGGAANHGDWIGYTAALASTMCFALGTIWLRSLSKTETTESLTFFTALAEAMFGLFFMLQHTAPVGFSLLLILFGMGVLCVLGNLANYWALKHTAAGNVAALHYSQIISGAIIGYLVWHDVPTMHMLIGAGIIIGSGIYVAAHVHKAQAQAQAL